MRSGDDICTKQWDSLSSPGRFWRHAGSKEVRCREPMAGKASRASSSSPEVSFRQFESHGYAHYFHFTEVSQLDRGFALLVEEAYAVGAQTSRERGG